MVINGQVGFEFWTIEGSLICAFHVVQDLNTFPKPSTFFSAIMVSGFTSSFQNKQPFETLQFL